MLASFTNIPQFALDENESAKLGAAIQRVTELYDVPIMSEESRAWINLAMAAGAIYGPRIGSYMIDKKAAQPKPVGPQRVN